MVSSDFFSGLRILLSSRLSPNSSVVAFLNFFFFSLSSISSVMRSQNIASRVIMLSVCFLFASCSLITSLLMTVTGTFYFLFMAFSGLWFRFWLSFWLYCGDFSVIGLLFGFCLLGVDFVALFVV